MYIYIFGNCIDIRKNKIDILYRDMYHLNKNRIPCSHIKVCEKCFPQKHSTRVVL